MNPTGILEIRGKGTLREYALTGGSVTLGRADDNNVILEDVVASRYHARFEWINSKPHLTDLGSANGTTINGKTITPNIPHPIEPDDIIQITGFQLILHDLANELGEGKGEFSRAFSGDEPAVLTRAEPSSVILSVNTPDWDKRFPILGEEMSVGRDLSNDICIDLPVVSRQHAKLEQVAHGYQIVDLGSSNGLTCQGVKISRTLLADGDVLNITGDISLNYEITPMAPSEAVTKLHAVSESTIPPLVEGSDQPEPAPLYATMVGVETHVSGLREIDMRERTQLTIGRGPENDLQLSYPSISRRHARISDQGDAKQYVIEDLGSINGTLVNNEFIDPQKPHPLLKGDKIRIGPIKFLFAPESMLLVDELRDLKLDAVHLNQFVSKEVNLLQDISLAIHPREFVAVVGVSGAGKSTLLNALAGLWPASDGVVLVNETDLYHNFDAFRTDLGYVPQDDIIHKELTAGKALDYAARLRLPGDMTASERRQAVTEELETLGLLERKDVRVGRLEWWAAQACVHRCGTADSPWTLLPGRSHLRTRPRYREPADAIAPSTCR